MTALSAHDIGVTIDKATLLVGVTLDVASGEWLSIIGPNGAGKSTLLRVLSGALSSTGSVEIDGQQLMDLKPKERSKLVSWVPQTPTIPIGMSVLDYVLLGRTPHLHPLASPSRADVQLAHDVIDDLDLADLVTRAVETLSGGERQRVVIGRALAQDAPIILLDEPTTALDLGHQQDVLRLLDRLRRTHERTIISTMHDLTMAGQFADRLILLAGGSIVAEGRPIDVLTAENIAEHYRASVDVTHRDGAVLVVPHIDRPDSHSNEEQSNGN
jgi:iron complex transport system ATP-binding protein